jgi:cytochrome c
MKTSVKILFSLGLAAVFAGSAFAQAAAIDGAAMTKLAADKNCATCHTVDKPGPFPNHKLIAKKYADSKDKDLVSKLAEKVIKGGSGSFGALPMPANAQVSKDDAEKLVRWMLAAK